MCNGGESTPTAFTLSTTHIHNQITLLSHAFNGILYSNLNITKLTQPKIVQRHTEETSLMKISFVLMKVKDQHLSEGGLATM
jgi:hypothetical protein